MSELGGVAELKEAVADPASFLERLAEASVPIALKLARPQLEPKLKARGLAWEDTAPVFEQLASPGGCLRSSVWILRPASEAAGLLRALRSGRRAGGVMAWRQGEPRERDCWPKSSFCSHWSCFGGGLRRACGCGGEGPGLPRSRPGV